MANPTIEVQHNGKVKRYFGSKLLRLQEHFEKAGYDTRLDFQGRTTVMRFEKKDCVQVFYVRNTIG